MATTEACMPDLASTEGDGELDKLIKNFEFEIQQYVKLIEKEKQQITAQEGQIDEHKREISRLQEAISQFDEDTKRYHRQFIQNRDNCDSLKKTSSVLSEHEAALQKTLCHLQAKGKEERSEQEEILEHYKRIWSEYKAKYESFPLAKKLAEKQKEKVSLGEKLSLAKAHVEKLKAALNRAKGATGNSFIPYTELSTFVVKLVQTKAETQKYEVQLKQLVSEIKGTENSIKTLEEKKAREKEEERKRKEQQEMARQEEKRKRAEQIAEENNERSEHQVDSTTSTNSKKSTQLDMPSFLPGTEAQASKELTSHKSNNATPQKQYVGSLAPRLQIPQLQTPHLTQRSIHPQYSRTPRSPGKTLKLPARIPVCAPNIQQNSQISAQPRMFRPSQIGIPSRSASPANTAAGVQNVRPLACLAQPRCYPPPASQCDNNRISPENLSAETTKSLCRSPFRPRQMTHFSCAGGQQERWKSPGISSSAKDAAAPELPQDDSTPNEPETHERSKASDRAFDGYASPPSDISAKSPRSCSASPFDLEKHLARIEQLSSKSPGFTFSSRLMFEGNKNQETTASSESGEQKRADFGKSLFMQPFFGGGDGPEHLAPPTSGKGLFSTEDGSDKQTYQASNTPASMAVMFGDAQNTVNAPQSSSFLSGSNNEGQNKTAFNFGGGDNDADPQGGTMFAMFGQCENSPPGHNSGFSLSFGSETRRPANPTSSASFSLF